MDTLFQATSFIGAAAVWIGVLLTLLLHILLAKAVADDCVHLTDNGRQPMLINAFVWLLAVLLSGLIGFALFWLMHYSSLRDASQDRSATSPKTL